MKNKRTKMKKSRVIIISAVTVMIAVIIVVAMKYRKNHRQIIDNNKLDNVYITQFYKELGELLDEEFDMEGRYDSSSSYILKVKCTKDTEFGYQTCTEYGQVEKIFRGDGELKVGDNIVMDRSGYHLFTKESEVTAGFDAVSTGFVNFMKPGREYLVFIKEKVETELYDYDVYTIEGFTIAPILCYEDIDNVIVPKKGSDHAVSYELVKDNEVFMETEELEKEYYDFKYRIISKFDEEYRKSHE